MNTPIKNENLGQSFDEYLKERGRYKDTTIRALFSLVIETLDDALEEVEKLLNESKESGQPNPISDVEIVNIVDGGERQIGQKFQQFRQSITDN